MLSFIEPWLLPVEAALGYLPLSLFGSFSLVGNAIFGNGHGVIVFTGCSAFANTITAAFIWLSLVKIQGTEFRGWHFRGLALSIAAIMLLNTARLTLMAYSYDGYVFWHNGYGATIMSLAMLLVVLGFFLLGREPARERRVKNLRRLTVGLVLLAGLFGTMLRLAADSPIDLSRITLSSGQTAGPFLVEAPEAHERGTRLRLRLPQCPRPIILDTVGPILRPSRKS